MSKYFSLIPVVLSAVALGAAAPAPAAAAGGSGTANAGVTTQARFGGFRGTRRAPGFGSRSPYRYRRGYPRGYRPHPFRGVGGAILRALGLAYLFHLMFGWGAGGSPFGLLLLGVLIVWLVSRRRRSPSPRWSQPRW